MYLTKKELEQYRRFKRSLEYKTSKLAESYEKEPESLVSTVKKTSKHFPYLEGLMGVWIYDPVESEKRDKRIQELSKDIYNLVKQTEAVENYISDIADEELQLIFSYRYIEGWKLKEIADKLNMDLSTVGKKITTYMKFSNNSKNEVL